MLFLFPISTAGNVYIHCTKAEFYQTNRTFSRASSLLGKSNTKSQQNQGFNPFLLSRRTLQFWTATQNGPQNNSSISLGSSFQSISTHEQLLDQLCLEWTFDTVLLPRICTTFLYLENSPLTYKSWQRYIHPSTGHRYKTPHDHWTHILWGFRSGTGDAQEQDQSKEFFQKQQWVQQSPG